MAALDDGIYEVIVVEATEQDDNSMVLDVAISSGERRGDVVQIRALNLRRSWMDMLAAPGRLQVVDGVPRLSLE